MDPPGTVPLFLSLTSGRSHAMRKRLACQAVLVAFFVITVFALFGQQILDYLGITLPSLQVAGGLLLLLVALELLTGKGDEPTETPERQRGARPARHAAARRARRDRRDHRVRQAASTTSPSALAIALGIVAVHVVLWLFLRFSVVIMRVIKDSGVTLVTRIAGLLLSAIAVQLVADGDHRVRQDA